MCIVKQSRNTHMVSEAYAVQADSSRRNRWTLVHVSWLGEWRLTANKQQLSKCTHDTDARHPDQGISDVMAKDKQICSLCLISNVACHKITHVGPNWAQPWAWARLPHSVATRNENRGG